MQKREDGQNALNVVRLEPFSGRSFPRRHAELANGIEALLLQLYAARLNASCSQVFKRAKDDDHDNATSGEMHGKVLQSGEQGSEAIVKELAVVERLDTLDKGGERLNGEVNCRAFLYVVVVIGIGGGFVITVIIRVRVVVMRGVGGRGVEATVL